MLWRPNSTLLAVTTAVSLGFGCATSAPPIVSPPDTHGPIATGISGKLGEPLPNLTADLQATFERC